MFVSTRLQDLIDLSWRTCLLSPLCVLWHPLKPFAFPVFSLIVELTWQFHITGSCHSCAFLGTMHQREKASCTFKWWKCVCTLASYQQEKSCSISKWSKQLFYTVYAWIVWSNKSFDEFLEATINLNVQVYTSTVYYFCNCIICCVWCYLLLCFVIHGLLTDSFIM